MKEARAVRLLPGISAVLLASLAVALGFVAIGDRDINLADEGYLWYGVKRLLAGDFPLRDFQAYDPGRYVWCAAFEPVFGSGVLGVRRAAAVFLAIGLACGLAAARRLGARALPWQLAALPVLWVWVFPRHKLFEPAITLALVLAFTRLFERPTRGARVLIGVLVGLAGWFGRNHALYGILAALLAFLVLVWKTRERGFLRCAGDFLLGAALGSAPYLIQLLTVPGLPAACLATVSDVAHRGTNVAVPWPWPWSVPWAELDAAAWMSEGTRVLSFLLPVLALGWGVLVLARTRGEDLASRSLVAAGLCVGLPYVHHVVVRSDMAHLAQAIHPLLLLVLALPRRAWTRAMCAAGLFALSAFAALEHHPQLNAFAPWRARTVFVEHPVAGETLRLREGQALYLGNVERTLEQYVRPEDALFVAPSRPTFYPMFDKRSPVRLIYMFWFATEAEEEEVRRGLEEQAVPWVFLVNTSVDEREDLRFERTYPGVMRYLALRYESVPTPLLPAGHALLRRRTP